MWPRVRKLLSILTIVWLKCFGCWSKQQSLSLYRFSRYATLEDFENGMKSYQNALRVDTRHYNAWYGLGMIYLRQEKLEFSEHHFRMAFLINPSSSVIMSYLGTALHALKVIFLHSFNRTFF